MTIALCVVVVATEFIVLATSARWSYVALIPVFGAFALLSVKMAPSHQRTVATIALLVAAAFYLWKVPYPNVGLPFGYWAYPNRAIVQFERCENVTSAKVDRWNHDFGVEEFVVDVAVSDEEGGNSTRGVAFDQFPAPQYIRERVATIECRS